MSAPFSLAALAANPSPVWRYGLYIGVVVVCVVAWVGFFDGQAELEIDEAFTRAGIIYGLARVLNGVISFIQDVDINVLVLSVSPGEFLDPLNDLIEQFSQVMTFALASLALQKVLLLITSHQVFNVLLTLAGINVLGGRWISPGYSLWALKVFITLFVLRLSLVLIILANSAVDALFLADQTQVHQQSLSSLEQDLSAIADSLNDGKAAALDDERTQALEAQLSDLAEQSLAISRTIKQKQQAIAQQQGIIRRMNSDAGLIDRLNPFREEKDPRVLRATAAINSLETEIDNLERRHKDVRQQQDTAREALDCEKRRAAGEACSVTEWLGNKTGTAAIRDRINRIEQSAEAKIDSVISLLTLMVLKTILLPLLFWWLIVRILKLLWRDDRWRDARGFDEGRVEQEATVPR
ncbi:MAG: hypothetical protein VR73_14315 [Gammaproteobacteria bacterium BRH_c0]|nr:MAG: hypothetical protein VR73_14315 [Gammaproteobacteria bacterium BRH_c0]